MNIFEALIEIQQRQRQDYDDMMQGLAAVRDYVGKVDGSVGKVEQSLQRYQQKSEEMFDMIKEELEGFSTRLEIVEKKAHTH